MKNNFFDLIKNEREYIIPQKLLNEKNIDKNYLINEMFYLSVDNNNLEKSKKILNAQNKTNNDFLLGSEVDDLIQYFDKTIELKKTVHFNGKLGSFLDNLEIPTNVDKSAISNNYFLICNKITNKPLMLLYKSYSDDYYQIIKGIGNVGFKEYVYNSCYNYFTKTLMPYVNFIISFLFSFIDDNGKNHYMINISLLISFLLIHFFIIIANDDNPAEIKSKEFLFRFSPSLFFTIISILYCLF